MSAARTVAARRRDRRIAAALSAFPGLGQIYNGQWAKALRLFVGTLLLIGGSVGVIVAGLAHRGPVFDSPGTMLLLATGSILAFLLGFLPGLFLWASSINDAYASAIALARGEAARRITFFHL